MPSPPTAGSKRGWSSIYPSSVHPFCMMWCLQTWSRDLNETCFTVTRRASGSCWKAFQDQRSKIRVIARSNALFRLRDIHWPSFVWRRYQRYGAEAEWLLKWSKGRFHQRQLTLTVGFLRTLTSSQHKSVSPTPVSDWSKVKPQLHLTEPQSPVKSQVRK